MSGPEDDPRYDDAHAECAEEIHALKRERDEALAWQRVAQERHPRCAAMDDQQGPCDCKAALDEAREDAEAYAKTLTYLTEVGATGHDLQGDATVGIASLVEQRDEARAALLVDKYGLASITWKEWARETSEANQQHMLERDRLAKALRAAREKVHHIYAHYAPDEVERSVKTDNGSSLCCYGQALQIIDAALKEVKP